MVTNSGGAEILESCATTASHMPVWKQPLLFCWISLEQLSNLWRVRKNCVLSFKAKALCSHFSLFLLLFSPNSYKHIFNFRCMWTIGLLNSFQYFWHSYMLGIWFTFNLWNKYLGFYKLGTFPDIGNNELFRSYSLIDRQTIPIACYSSNIVKHAVEP